MKKILHFFLLHSFLLTAQIQQGPFLKGETIGDDFGSEVSISQNGARIAIAAPEFNADSNDPGGYVKIYEYNTNHWIQLGENILGKNETDQFGKGIALSGNGNRIVIGAPKNDDNGSSSGIVQVYDYDGANWIQVGQNVIGATNSEEFGYSVSITPDGNRMVVGIPQTNFGAIQAYDYNGSEWIQAGNTITGETGNRFGNSVYISENGLNLIGVGKFGIVRVYRFDDTNDTWNQIGQDVVGSSNGKYSLSDDGTRFAVGFPEDNNVGGDDAGKVIVYQLNGDTWEQLGQDLNGVSRFDRFGKAVVISKDGNRVVATAPGRGGAGLSIEGRGQVRVYDFDNNTLTWEQRGVGIDNVAGGITSLCLSGDGFKIVFGSTDNLIDPYGDYVWIYDIERDLNIANLNYVYGKVTSDFGNNGCAEMNLEQGNAKVMADNSSQIVETYSNVDGSYKLYLDQGTYDLGVQVKNTTDIIPAAEDVVLNESNASQELNLCVESMITFDGQFTFEAIDGVIIGRDRSIALSENGDYLAIGNPGYDVDQSDDYDAGQVIVYQDINGSWTPIGQPLIGSQRDDYFGEEIALSADGLRLAVGISGESRSVRVYELVNNSWTEMGQLLPAGLETSVSLSSDGTILSIGVPRSNLGRGIVRLYQYNGTSWEQLGQDIEGNDNDGFSGIAISLSSDGMRVAIGAPEHSGEFFWNDHYGQVRVFEFDTATNDWIQMGTEIFGDATDDFLGTSVSLSSDGFTMAVSAYQFAQGKGYTRIYSYNGSDWNQLGNDITGDLPGDLSGSSIWLSSDGNYIVIGTPWNNGGTNNSSLGAISIYKFENSQWKKYIDDIVDTVDNESGLAVCLSSDGKKLAVRGTREVKTYNLDLTIGEVLSIEEFEKNKLAVFPVPVEDFLNIQKIGNQHINKIRIYDIKGALIKDYKNSKVIDLQKINVSDLNEGIYLVQLEMNGEFFIKKIVKR